MNIFILTFFTVILALATANEPNYNGNGQPACNSQDELDIAIFRDTWDPTHYWKCTALNQPAELNRCPDQTGFMESRKTCVNWKDWEWEQPIAPLNAADKTFDEEEPEIATVLI